MVRLADCIRVSEVELDGCPRDTGPFLIETTEKIHLFAADRQQLDDWMHKLCEVAFPVGKPAVTFDPLPHTHTSPAVPAVQVGWPCHPGSCSDWLLADLEQVRDHTWALWADLRSHGEVT